MRADDVDDPISKLDVGELLSDILIQCMMRILYFQVFAYYQSRFCCCCCCCCCCCFFGGGGGGGGDQKNENVKFTLFLFLLFAYSLFDDVNK